MVLLQGIAAAALVPLGSQPELQWVLVWMMVGVTCTITLVVVIVVLWFAFRNLGLLFSPRDISSEVHVDLYGANTPIPRTRPSIPPGDITLEVSPESDEGQDQ